MGSQSKCSKLWFILTLLNLLIFTYKSKDSRLLGSSKLIYKSELKPFYEKDKLTLSIPMNFP